MDNFNVFMNETYTIMINYYMVLSIYPPYKVFIKFKDQFLMII